MPNVRAAGKVMLGAQVTQELSAAVDEWQRRNFPKTRSDFIVEASLDKLAKDEVEVDRVAVLRDARSRIHHPQGKPITSYRAEERSRRINSKPLSAAERTAIASVPAAQKLAQELAPKQKADAPSADKPAPVGGAVKGKK